MISEIDDGVYEYWYNQSLSDSRVYNVNLYSRAGTFN